MVRPLNKLATVLEKAKSCSSGVVKSYSIRRLKMVMTKIQTGIWPTSFPNSSEVENLHNAIFGVHSSQIMLVQESLEGFRLLVLICNYAWREHRHAGYSCKWRESSLKEFVMGSSCTWVILSSQLIYLLSHWLRLYCKQLGFPSVSSYIVSEFVAI